MVQWGPLSRSFLGHLASQPCLFLRGALFPLQLRVHPSVQMVPQGPVFQKDPLFLLVHLSLAHPVGLGDLVDLADPEFHSCLFLLELPSHLSVPLQQVQLGLAGLGFPEAPRGQEVLVCLEVL